MDRSLRLLGNKDDCLYTSKQGICTHPTYCSCSSGYPLPLLYIHDRFLLTYAEASMCCKTALVKSWVVLFPRMSGVLTFLKQASVKYFAHTIQYIPFQDDIIDPL